MTHLTDVSFIFAKGVKDTFRAFSNSTDRDKYMSIDHIFINNQSSPSAITIYKSTDSDPYYITKEDSVYTDVFSDCEELVNARYAFANRKCSAGC